MAKHSKRNETTETADGDSAVAVLDAPESETQARLPRVGDWVHFVVSKDMPQYTSGVEFTGFNQDHAAMIAGVYEDGSVFLHVWSPRSQFPSHVPKASHDASGKTPWTWHFAD